MTQDFFGMIAAAVGMGAFMFALNHLTGKRLAKWAMPAAIGAAMIGFTIYREYSWYPTVRAALPSEVVIVLAPKDTYFYRPWTYLVPLTQRFLAVDRTKLAHPVERPDLVLVDALVVQRWAPTQRVPMVFDCTAGRRADLLDAAMISGAGELTGAEWHDVGPGDPALNAACKGA